MRPRSSITTRRSRPGSTSRTRARFAAGSESPLHAPERQIPVLDEPAPQRALECVPADQRAEPVTAERQVPPDRHERADQSIARALELEAGREVVVRFEPKPRACRELGRG